MSGPDLDPALRLEAHALLDRLVGEGSHLLIRRCPAPDRACADDTSLPVLVCGHSHRAAAAACAGMPPASARSTWKGRARDKRLSWKAPRLYRIGGYEVTHAPGEIGISLMWHETRIDQSGQSCVLVYDAITSEPREMLIARHRVLRLFVLRLGYVSYIPWKTPVTG